MPSTPIGACLAKARGTAMLWNAVCVAIVLLGPGRALGAAVEVEARSAHEAVWKVYGAGTSGTAFAIGDHHFPHVRPRHQGFLRPRREGGLHQPARSTDSRRLRVNYGHAALTLVQDIALFTTKETVDYYFALAESGALEGAAGLRIMGHPAGLPLETLYQTDPIAFQDEFQLTVPADKITRGGLSGSPLFGDDGKVVGMHCQGSDNMIIAVKGEHLRKFLDGDLAWTACRDHPSVAACVERATRQTSRAGRSGRPAGAVSARTRRRPPRQGPRHAAPGRGGRMGVGAGLAGQVVEGTRTMDRVGPVVQAKRRTGGSAGPIWPRFGVLQGTRGATGPRAGLRAHASSSPERIRHCRIWCGIVVRDGRRNHA